MSWTSAIDALTSFTIRIAAEVWDNLAMETIAEGSIIFVVLVGPMLVALAIRRRIRHRPTLGMWLVVGAAVIGIILGIAAAQWRHDRLERRKIDRLVEGLDPIPCSKAAPADPRWRAMYEVKCSPMRREAFLQGTVKHPGLSVSVQISGDRLVALWLPRSDGPYRVWLVDAGGKVVETVRPDPSMITIIERPGLASGVKLVATFDADNAASPTGPVIAEAPLQPAH